MKVEIVKIYKGDDPACVSDPLQVYLYIDKELVLKGDHYHNSIDDMVAGAIALLHFQQKEFTQIKYRVADSSIYYQSNSPEQILEKAKNHPISNKTVV